MNDVTTEKTMWINTAKEPTHKCVAETMLNRIDHWINEIHECYNDSINLHRMGLTTDEQHKEIGLKMSCKSETLRKVSDDMYALFKDRTTNVAKEK